MRLRIAVLVSGLALGSAVSAGAGEPPAQTPATCLPTAPNCRDTFDCTTPERAAESNRVAGFDVCSLPSPTPPAPPSEPPPAAAAPEPVIARPKFTG
jgi:hypothetical protein